MDINTLLNTVAEYLPEDKVSLVGKAYERAVGAHQGQLRRSGGPFVEHPLQTAITLADLHLDA